MDDVSEVFCVLEGSRRKRANRVGGSPVDIGCNAQEIYRLTDILSSEWLADLTEGYWQGAVRMY